MIYLASEDGHRETDDQTEENICDQTLLTWQQHHGQQSGDHHTRETGSPPFSHDWRDGRSSCSAANTKDTHILSVTVSESLTGCQFAVSACPVAVVDLQKRGDLV